MALNQESLDTFLSFMQDHYTKAQGQKELLDQSLISAEERLCNLQLNVNQGELVQALFTKTSEYARTQLKKRVEDTVTAGIQAIFQNNDEFLVEIKEYRGQPGADWRVKTEGGIVDFENSDGGGLVDGISVALRLSIMETSRPKPEGPIFLDESGKHLSQEYLPNMAEFIKQYARTTGRQLFLITHWKELAEVADVSYIVAKNEAGVSEVKQNAN